MDVDDLSALRKVVTNHEVWLQEKPAEYGGVQGPLPTVVITETPLFGGYISNTVRDLAVVTIARWDSTFAPPSALEFLLLSVQRLSARIGLSSELGSHYPTRACLWDFTANVADIRAAILAGYICEDCSVALKSKLSSTEISDFRVLVEHGWLGKLDEAGSVASNLKRIFDYDLATTRGLSESPVQKFLSVLWGPETLKALYAALFAAVVWYLAKHGIKIEIPK